MDNTRSQDLLNTLNRALDSRALSKPLLLSGPYGIGKLNLVMDLASSILKESLSKHPFFLHSDLFILYPETKTAYHSIDQIQKMVHFVHQTPTHANARCVIIDDADRILPLHANTILKCFEEHPVTTHIFLVSSHLEAIIPTVRSRCWHVSIPKSNSEQILTSIKPYKLTKDQSSQIINLSSGSQFSAKRFAQELSDNETFIPDDLVSFLKQNEVASSSSISQVAQGIAQEIQRQKEIYQKELDDTFSVNNYKEITPYQKERLVKVNQAKLSLFEVRYASCYLDAIQHLLSSQLKEEADANIEYYQRAIDLGIVAKDQLNKSIPHERIFESFLSNLKQHTRVWVPAPQF